MSFRLKAWFVLDDDSDSRSVLDDRVVDVLLNGFFAYVWRGMVPPPFGFSLLALDTSPLWITFLIILTNTVDESSFKR